MAKQKQQKLQPCDRVVPLAERIVVIPLSGYCSSCERLTRSGGACPGTAPLTDPMAPMCHSQNDEFYSRLYKYN